MTTPSDTIFTGQIGTTIRVTITKLVGGIDTPVDITTATLVEMQFKRPNGTKFKKTATKVMPYSGGVIEYVNTTPSIFDERGRWQLQGIATFSDGDYFPGTWTGFSVDES